MSFEKIIKTKPCRTCQQSFEITDKDLSFYEKIQAPEPKDCYHCRQRHRQAFRNEHNLYKNKCALCKKDILSVYSEDKPFPVYCRECWWGDEWDPFDYGQDFDFNKPFFEQWKELWDKVPKLSLIVPGHSINADYVNDVQKLVNCYLVFDGEQAKDCMYGETFVLIKDCLDFLWLRDSELIYECTNCTNCYNLNHSEFCHNCSESSFLLDCVGCQNCLGCVNRHRAKFEIFNKEYEKEEYGKRVRSFGLDNYLNLEKFKREFRSFALSQPKKSMRGIKNENVTGDNINNSKDSFYCFDSLGLRDCKYCTNIVLSANDCFDVDVWGDRLNVAYNCECTGNGGERIFACYYGSHSASDLYHSAFCMHGNSNLLGCVGLKHKKFCILNKQYSEEEYRSLFNKIKEHMLHTGEWMEFFPTWASAFAYNETVAQEYFPLTQEETLKRGYKWKEKDKSRYRPQTFKIPDTIEETEDSITNEILACESCGKNFKILSQELKFYRRKLIPIPHKCYDCRYLDKLHLRNPRFLWKQTCAKTGQELMTTYSPERPEVIYSPETYVKEFF